MIRVIATLGVRELDKAFSDIPNEIARVLGPYHKLRGYKAWKAGLRMETNWAQWNDGDKVLRIGFPNVHGEMKTWKLFARFGDDFAPQGPWDRPVPYEKDGSRRWMPAGPDVWACSYEDLSQFQNRPTDLERILVADLALSLLYTKHRYESNL